jgi:hypothetical protein
MGYLLLRGLRPFCGTLDRAKDNHSIGQLRIQRNRFARTAIAKVDVSSGSDLPVPRAA